MNSNQDEEHLRLLSIFHYVCAGIIAVFGCMPIFHLLMGILVLANPRSMGAEPVAVRIIVGCMFVVVPLLLMGFLWTVAALLAWAGRCLGRRVNYTFCLVMGAVACVFMPFGAVLGVFTILVLMRSSVKDLFNRATRPPVFS